MNQHAQQFSDALADAVDRVAPSVVRVGAGRRHPSSGLVWAANGLIVSAAHGLDREEAVEVYSESGQAHAASLIGVDSASDIALLRAEGSDWQTFERAPGTSIRRGHLVLALGRPGRSVRSQLGVVSALGDEWRTFAGAKLERYIQSDLSIEPGFSGGALIDVSGRVIGMNSSGLLRGAALTLALSTLERVVEALLAHGVVRRGFLGVSSVPAQLPAALATSAGQRAGLVLTGLQAGGPAESAGLLLGDVLLSLDGQRLESIADLQVALDERAGQSVSLRLSRAGSPLELSVTPSARS